MEYKRLEVYVGWTCNHKCTYCKEFPNMEKIWDKKVTKYEILKLLIKYKKGWFNHVSFLWWEPFIQPVFLDALKLWKKLWYTILVTTNSTTLHIDTQAKKYLPYIDNLILSMEAIDEKTQKIISRSNSFVHWHDVIANINKYWKGTMLKVNIVIVKDNLHLLFDLVQFCFNNSLLDIAISYPDLDLDYYWKEHTLNLIAPSYKECIDKILPIIKHCEDKKIRLKLPDFPFCVFPKEHLSSYIKLTDDFDYQTRVNMYRNDIEINRLDLSDDNMIPRERSHLPKCKECIYTNMCWGPSIYYDRLYSFKEINPII